MISGFDSAAICGLASGGGVSQAVTVSSGQVRALGGSMEKDSIAAGDGAPSGITAGEASTGLSRRAMMRTAVVAAGVAAWSAPSVLRVTADPALAGSPAPVPGGSTVESTVESTVQETGGLLTDTVDSTLSTGGSLLNRILGRL